MGAIITAQVRSNISYGEVSGISKVGKIVGYTNDKIIERDDGSEIEYDDYSEIDISRNLEETVVDYVLGILWCFS